ncbi:unnamed protein product [Trichobilharzia regenti]|nr:unnamed protein product [Trichobilharzia regenti]
MKSGLQKLAEASIQLEELNAKLAVQRVAVTEKTQACENLLQEITASSQLATEKKELAVTKSKEIQVQSVEIQQEKVTGFVCVCVCLHTHCYSLVQCTNCVSDFISVF